MIPLVASILVLLAPGSVFGSNSQIERLSRHNNLLRSEYRLAKKRELYFIFDLHGKKILFKARGVELKRLPIEYYRMWGSFPEVQPFVLRKKSSLVGPKRKLVRTKKGEGGETEAVHEPVSLEDMPARFSLYLNGSIGIYIRSGSDGVRDAILNVLGDLKVYLVTRPIIGFLRALQKKPFTEITIYLDRKDARSLYWTLSEGLSCIVYY